MDPANPAPSTAPAAAGDDDRPFHFLRTNARPPKPRTRGVTEIRGPYYTPVGPGYLRELLQTWGGCVDSFKFAGGAFALMPRRAVRELIELCHSFDVAVSTGGFIEYVLTQGPAAVDRYVDECKGLGFDVIELSSGFITLPVESQLRLIDRVHRAGLRAKPEVGIQFGAGGASAAAELEAEGTRDVGWVVAQAKRFLEAGAHLIMIESEGITESVTTWRTDVPARFARPSAWSGSCSRPPTRTSSPGTSRTSART